MNSINKLKGIIRKLKINKIATALLLSAVLFVTTACNSGNEQGARPNNSPVQMGGQNNPHKAEGDNMTQYRSPVNDSNLNKDSASLPAAFYLG